MTSISIITKQLGLNADEWNNELWKETWNDINEDTVNDAFSMHQKINQILEPVGFPLTHRPNPKRLDRINEKKLDQKWTKNYFKAVSDLCAIRYVANLTDFGTIIMRILNIAKSKNAIVYVRDTDRYPYYVNDDGAFIDISQYLYVFFDEIGYPIEVQIIHPFANIAFSNDSATRNNTDPTNTSNADTTINMDLWQDGFFNNVKNYICAIAANHKPEHTYPVLIAKLKEIYGNTTVPADLLNAIPIA